MVLIILDVLSCDVPMNACACAPPRVSDLSEVYKSTDAFAHLMVFSISVLAQTWDLFRYSSHSASHVLGF